MALPALVAPGFWRHPKLFRLAAALEQHKLMVGGSLIALWGWCHEYRPTGSLEGLSDAEIAGAAEWPGDASRYVAALRACGWLDSLEVHDFTTRQGKKAILNAQAALRMANKREHERNASVTETKSSVTPVPLPLPVPEPVPPPIPNDGGAAYALAEIRGIFKSPGDLAKGRKFDDIARQGLPLRELVDHLKANCRGADFYEAVEDWRKSKAPPKARASPPVVTGERKTVRWTPPPPEPEETRGNTDSAASH